MKAKNILDGSSYRLDWLVWLRGAPGVLIIIVALAILVGIVGWHFFKLHAEAERSNVITKPVTQSATQLASTQPAAPIATQEEIDKILKDINGGNQETVVPDRPKAVRKAGKHSGKHYSVEAKNEGEAATETTTQDEQEVTVKSDSFTSATGEAPVIEPVVDYWSSINGYVKAVENQSKKNDEILKELNGGE